MTSSDRDLIDKEVNAIIDICTKRIFELKMENEVLQVVHQQKLHTAMIIDLLMNYLKAVYNIFSDQKNYRVNRDLESYRFLKLNATSKLHKQEDDEGTDEFIDTKKEDDVKENEFGLKRRKVQSTKNENQPIENYDDGNENETLDPKDLMQLEIENKQLLTVYKGLSEEIQMIERNALDIAKLQNIFSENVTAQKYDIERISQTVIATTENVREANQQIKEATQRNAGLRVYLLFFFIVMSFSLLFLDWYND
jgi:syntaxin 18